MDRIIPKKWKYLVASIDKLIFYSQDGIFNEKIISNIGQFPEKRHFNNFDYNPKIVTDTARFWLKAQEQINLNKKLYFFKTHNAFGSVNNNQFTDAKNSMTIYIIRDQEMSLRH